MHSPRVSPSQRTGTAAACAPSVSCTASSNGSTVDAHQDQDGNIYVRAWRFVQRRLHLRPRACSCPVDMDNRSSAESVDDPQSSSYSCQWQRVYLLKELEEVGALAQRRRQRQECIKETAEWNEPVFRTQAQRKASQLPCYNCGLLFFRPLAVAQDTSAFCSRDCQSSFEYRRELQDAVNEHETFRSAAATNWTRSSEL
jgi:hypothetical protein